MRKLATIQVISDLQPIDGANNIEKAQVNGWWVVVKKGEFKINDKCVYFEIDSLLPNIEPFAFLGRSSALREVNVDGEIKKGFRLKTVKLRKQISQGLALPINQLIPYSKVDFSDFEVGYDCSDDLGIYKWEMPIPACLGGKVKGSFPGFLRKTDEERIQNISNKLISPYYVSEKLDGSSATFYKKDGIFGVCSRNLELEESEENVFWIVARQLNLADKLPDNMCIQGELVGEKIQKNPYKINGVDVYFYNAYVIYPGYYLNFYDFKNFIKELGLKTVPILNERYALPATLDELLLYAEGKSKLNKDVDREGIVIRTRLNNENERTSFKVISNSYLLKEVD